MSVERAAPVDVGEIAEADSRARSPGPASQLEPLTAAAALRRLAAGDRDARTASRRVAVRAPAAVASLQRTAGNHAATAAVATAEPRAYPVLARCAGRCTCEGTCADDLVDDLRFRASAPKLSRVPAEQAVQRKLAACVAARARPTQRAEVRAPRVVARRSSHRLLQRSPGSPAGGCGVCYGGPRQAGIAAHAIIGAAFETFYSGLVIAELPFLAPAPGDDNGRLDLVMPTADGFDIGEIKPANAAGLLDGDRDLLWYEMQIQRRFNMRVGRMTLPPPPISLGFPNPQAPGCPTQALFVERWPQPAGIYTYWCEPDFSVLVRDPRCRCTRRREPDPHPVREPKRVRAPRTVLEKVRDFVREVVEGGANAEEAARRFVQENPDVVTYLKAALIGAAILIVVLTLAEDIATLGAGLLDDPASFAAAFALVRVAQQMR